jgi:hypothetical protein
MPGPRTFLSFVLLWCISAGYGQQVAAPVLGAAAGYYPDSIFLSVSCSTTGASIYYTMDGSEPGPTAALYTSPLLIRDRSAAPNGISVIPTNPGFSFPVPGYDSARANSRGWLPPYDTVNKCTILKVKAFKNGFIPSVTVSATYFIGPLLSARYPFPVFSIQADSADLFSDSSGIFVYGYDTTDEGNYSKPGWEKKVEVELFDPNGNQVLAQYCGLKIHGNGGRHAPQKSLWLQAGSQYGFDKFDYLFFSSQPFRLKEILVRNSGHRPDCMPRDDLAGLITNGLHCEVQQEYPCVVFVNGEYWGLQTVKNLLNLKFLEAKYNVTKYQAAVISGGGILDDGLPGDEQPFLDLLSFVAGANIALQQNYNYVNTKIDLESFTDFECSEIFLGNGDWPNNNTKLWRYKSGYNPASTNALDGRWHWMMYDLDAGFGGDCNGVSASFNTLSNALDSTFGVHTLLLRTLINNSVYRNYFINRFADLLNTTFEPNRVRAIMAQLNAMLTPGMLEHVTRWRYPSVATTLLARSQEVPALTKWNTINASLYNYAGLRPYKVRKHMMTAFNLADTVHVTLDVSDTAAGKIRMNTICIDRFTPGAGPVPYPWTGVYFNGNPVTVAAVVNPGYLFLHWNDPSKTQNPITINIASDSLVTAVFGADTAFHALHYLFINEVMSRNISYLHDDYNEYDDWLEIWNPNNFAVDIAGCYLSDNPGNRTKYRIPAGSPSTVIPAKGFLLLWADSTAQQGSIHTSFRLGGQGDELFLTLPDGTTLVDSVIIPGMSANRSWGRNRDGDSLWITWQDPTPRMPNLPKEDRIEPETLLYPNPAVNTDQVHFSGAVSGYICDAIGNTVGTLENALTFNISTLAKGIYFLKTTSGEIVKFAKL